MTYPDRTVYPVASPNLTDFYNLVGVSPRRMLSGTEQRCAQRRMCGGPAKGPAWASSVTTTRNSNMKDARDGLLACDCRHFHRYRRPQVYLDAVFFPRLEHWAFRQEGWSLELAPPAAADAAASSGNGGPPVSAAGSSGARPGLAYRGVVYNEMKGVYSSPDAVHSYTADAALWPANSYRRSSGGDPLAIPELTYEQYRDFHRRWYSPANARAFFFGDDDPSRRLALLDEYFTAAAARFGLGDVSSGGGKVLV
jgi:Zn-dependent M16 (insulinase) family peptidase